MFKIAEIIIRGETEARLIKLKENKIVDEERTLSK